MLSEAEGGAAHAALRLQPDSKLQVLAAMAMSSNADAHGVAAMGLATLCNAPGNTTSSSGSGGGGANTALIAKVALPALVRLARSSAADTQCAALDALVVLSDLPQVQRDLVKMGALKVVLERAATPGADNADIRALALQVVQSLASNGSNIRTLQSGEVAARLKGLRQHMRDDVAVGAAGRLTQPYQPYDPNPSPTSNPYNRHRHPHPHPQPNPNAPTRWGAQWTPS